MIANEQKKQEIFIRLKVVIEHVLQISREKNLRNRIEVAWNTDIINDLEIDSLEIMDLIGAVEKEFGISLNIEKVVSQRIIREIVDYIYMILQ